MTADQHVDGNGSSAETPEQLAVDANDPAADDPDQGREDAPEPLPDWLRYTLLGTFVTSGILLLIAFVYPRLRSVPSGNTSGSALPDWKKQANRMIDVAIEDGMDGVPELLSGLNSTHPKIRQNAEWGLHHVTGLPWADKPDRCREWWKQYKDRVRQGESPPASPPSSPRFPRRHPLSKINLEVFFNLLSSGRVTLTGGRILANYEVGIVNRNEHTSVRIFPPDKLPYRAYRYRPSVPAKIARKYNVPETIGNVPVHLKYGPSVALILIKWYDPGRSLSTPVRSEFLKYNVLGRGGDVLKPGQMKSTRSQFPIRWDSELMTDAGPHVVARLVLDGRSLLLGYGTDRKKKIRGTFRDVSHVLKIFKEQPESVPGFADERLKSLRTQARREGYRFVRAERMTVGGYVTGPSGERTPVDPGSADQRIGPSPSDPATSAADSDDLARNTLIYVQELGWASVQESCSRCSKMLKQKRLLSRVEVRLPASAGAPNPGPSGTPSDRRWILVFEQR